MCRRLLCYGDSNTYGYDPRSYLGGRYPKSARWTGLLDAEGWKVINKGENGRSIPKLSCEIDAAIQMVCGTEADILTVMLGSTDLLQGSTAEVCGERMERFLSAILTRAPETPNILLIAPPPMVPGAWASDPETVEESRKLADCFEAIAHQLGVSFTDAGAWNVGLSYDGVHFSEEGHLAFAKGIQKALITLL